MEKTLSFLMALFPNRRTEPPVQIYRDPEELARGAADHFCAVAAQPLALRGSFTVALAGGNTPRRLYCLLAQEPWRSNIAWRKVHVFWGDERCVPQDHPESNYAMAMRDWLSRVELPRENIHRMPAELPDHDGAARSYEEMLRAFFATQGEESPCFDLILLGMGADGHVASLFPGSAATRETRRWVVSVHSPKPPIERLTLTLAVLNEAACITFLVSGREKARMVKQVLEASDVREPVPAALVRPRRGTLLWMLDRAAGPGLRFDRKSR